MSETRKKVHLVVGARPNFMKISPLYREFRKFPEKFRIKLIHTGQHYDSRMSNFFFHDLRLPQPDEYLEVGSGTHGEQTARIMERYERVLQEDRPDLVIVAGDVNSTVACALDAVKMHIQVAHLEAGLRSFDRSMPEEINRILTDAVSDYLLTPSPDADQNLIREGISPEKIHFVGNIMIDALIEHKVKATQSEILSTYGLQQKKYALITLHRPANVDIETSLSKILNAFRAISRKIKLVFPIHPRTRKQLSLFHLDHAAAEIPDLLLLEPVGYFDFIKLQMEAKFILTDSGGIQEESTWFGIPCLTLRPNTERPITISEGTNQLIRLDTDAIIEAVETILQGNVKKGTIPRFWDGNTAARVVKIFR
ncbi:MAG: UDP-N-acetylglucosamine 2-epimerase (non-hydrolyzing) [Candidatus Cloacimonetes bacterium]|nr:UDP-N-acetylglucosamine 2-epimerase (non-hydrolyzing) [Candidatus Cloacimonadota bacterium]